MTLPEPSNVLTLEGPIDLHVSPQVASALGAILESQPVRVVVDLSAVNYIDSSGLAVLIRGAQQVESYGGRLMLANVQEDVCSILETARVAEFFVIFPHVDAALAAI
ncbi:MAG: STAS domain-containing protein [Chthoniobacterales bacterium]